MKTRLFWGAAAGALALLAAAATADACTRAVYLGRDGLVITGRTMDWKEEIGTNLYLCKVAMDIVAKRLPPDERGARIAQLDELGDTLAANRNGLFSKKLCRGFELFSHRAGRLHSQTASLREYSLQLHQIYQSKIDLKQNRVMQFLTVVTTVFMPLTLITGWYGMNFHSMPELDAPWAYPAVILVSLAILLAEVLFFRRKKW